MTSKTNQNSGAVFSRAFDSFVGLISSHWLLRVFTFILIGCCDNFGFGFTTLNRKVLYTIHEELNNLLLTRRLKGSGWEPGPEMFHVQQ